MSKKEQYLDRFIEMRIQGYTFEEIAKELDVSKQSLITWNKEEAAKESIKRGKLFKHQSVLKAFELNREAKINQLAKLAKRINEEIEKRDFSEIPTEKLFKLAVMNEKWLLDKVQSYKIVEGEGWNLTEVFKTKTHSFNPED
jgi:DNA-binding XRE family transcriptional regulator